MEAEAAAQAEAEGRPTAAGARAGRPRQAKQPKSKPVQAVRVGINPIVTSAKQPLNVIGNLV